MLWGAQETRALESSPVPFPPQERIQLYDVFLTRKTLGEITQSNLGTTL